MLLSQVWCPFEKSGNFVDLGNYILFSLFILKKKPQCNKLYHSDAMINTWLYWQSYRIDNKEIFLQLVFALCYFSKYRKEDKISNIYTSLLVP